MVDAFPIWPRRRSTAVALIGLVVLQVTLFFVVTQRSFFTHEDYYNFALARERHLLQYLATPIIHTYPAPGNRLLFFLLDQSFPMNYVAARALLLAMLAGTTLLLGQLVRTLARSDRWWTVALLTPFALSLTLVSPVNLWSNGVPVIPALLFTVAALSAWIKSYTDPNRTFWVGVTVFAMAAAGAFYMKFLLIPIYLFLFRVAILPRLMNLPVSLRHLWQERMRWIAVAAPLVGFLSIYLFSGLASRSYVPGDRPYLEYLTTAWFRVFVPVSILNIPPDESPPSAASLPPPTAVSWPVIVLSHVLFWAMVGATWKRSALALRGWALFAIVFATNLLMVGAVRLPGFGVQIAYWLRYYPEVVLFLPIALALGLRQGEERRPDVAWERTRAGRTTIALLACVHAISFAIWAPRMVSKSDGAMARVWVDRLRRDVNAVRVDKAAPRIVDSETPEYVVLSWMAPYNRVSTILGLLQVDAVYNDLSGPTYFVLPDGRLTEARFRPMGQLLPDTTLGDRATPPDTCFQDGRALQYRPSAAVTGERLALRVRYSARSRQPVALQVDTDDPDRRYRDLELRPFQSAAELVDLATSRVGAIRVEPSPGDTVCFERMEIGSLRR
jgi:hypothetical protein